MEGVGAPEPEGAPGARSRGPGEQDRELRELREAPEPTGSPLHRPRTRRSTLIPTGGSPEVAALVQQEMSNLKALKRLSIGHYGSPLDPDLPYGMDWETGQPGAPVTSPQGPSQGPADHQPVPPKTPDPKTPDMSQLSLSPTPDTEISPTQARELLWVPAHVHPELAPNEWKTFVEGKVAEIKRSVRERSSSQSSSRSASSVSSRLSREIADGSGYSDGSELLEQKRRSSNSSEKQSRRLSILELSMQYRNLGELESLASMPISPATEDSPVLNAPERPGASLRRSSAQSRRRGRPELRKRPSTEPNSPASAGSDADLVLGRSSSQSAALDGLPKAMSSVPDTPTPHAGDIQQQQLLPLRTGSPVSRTSAAPAASIAPLSFVRRRSDRQPTSASGPEVPEKSDAWQPERLNTTENLHRQSSYPQRSVSQGIDLHRNATVDAYTQGQGSGKGIDIRQRSDRPHAPTTPDTEKPLPNVVQDRPNRASPTEGRNNTSGPADNAVAPVVPLKTMHNSSSRIDPPSSTAPPPPVPKSAEPKQSEHAKDTAVLPRSGSTHGSAPSVTPAPRTSSRKPLAINVEASYSDFSDPRSSPSPPTSAKEAVKVPEEEKEKEKEEKSVWRWLQKDKDKDSKSDAKDKDKDENSVVSPTAKTFGNLFKKKKKEDKKPDEAAATPVQSPSSATSPGNSPRGARGHHRSDSRTIAGSPTDSVPVAQKNEAAKPPVRKPVKKKEPASPGVTKPRRGKDKDKRKSREMNKSSKNDGDGRSRSGPESGSGTPAEGGAATQAIQLPYAIPAHQLSDRSYVMMYHRFPLYIERAIYRLSHMKLANPRRPLREQVLLSNFMYAYLNLVNQGYQQQMMAKQNGEDVDSGATGSGPNGEPTGPMHGYGGSEPVYGQMDASYDAMQQDYGSLGGSQYGGYEGGYDESGPYNDGYEYEEGYDEVEAYEEGYDGYGYDEYAENGGAGYDDYGSQDYGQPVVGQSPSSSHGGSQTFEPTGRSASSNSTSQMQVGYGDVAPRTSSRSRNGSRHGSRSSQSSQSSHSGHQGDARGSQGPHSQQDFYKNYDFEFYDDGNDNSSSSSSSSSEVEELWEADRAGRPVRVSGQ